MKKFSIPTREEVSESNKAIFDSLEKGIGFVPNLYAFYAKNETALGDYLSLQNRKTSLSGKEKEVVNLVTSEVNGCHYCLSAHTAIGKMNGFSEDQILEIRQGTAIFDSKLNALAQFTKSTVENRGKASEDSKSLFFEAGYDEKSLIDVVMLIGDKTISNFIHRLTNFEIDFPIAQSLELAK